MSKVDLKKELRELYFPSAKEVSIVDVPSMNFIVLDGVVKAGEKVSESLEFQNSFPVLYGLSYTLKFMLKKTGLPEYVVMPLEALWWTDEEGGFDIGNTKVPWRFRVMIVQPDFITREHYLQAGEQLKTKKDPPGLLKARFERFHEGKCVQIMHVGPYAEEGPTIQKLHDFAESNGCKLHDKHHEIYLSDPRRTRPERLKTVLRHPIE